MTSDNLHAKFINQGSTVGKNYRSGKGLECALEIIIRNTDIKTNEIHRGCFENQPKILCSANCIRRMLERRVEREINEHFKNHSGRQVFSHEAIVHMPAYMQTKVRDPSSYNFRSDLLFLERGRFNNITWRPFQYIFEVLSCLKWWYT